MRKVILYVILIGIGLGGYLFLAQYKCSAYSCISFDGKDTYHVKEEYENSSKVYRAMLQNGNVHIRIEAYADISAEKAASYNKIKEMNIESLYETAKSPYPGALSNEIECGTEYRPHIGKMTTNGIQITYIRGYLNDRLQFGSCIKEEIKYTSYLALFHCTTQKKWYQFEIISPLNEEGHEKDIIDSIMCK